MTGPEWGVIAMVGGFVGILFTVIFVILPHHENQFKDDCVALGGDHVVLNGSEYCELKGEVYPR